MVPDVSAPPEPVISPLRSWLGQDPSANKGNHKSAIILVAFRLAQYIRRLPKSQMALGSRTSWPIVSSSSGSCASSRINTPDDSTPSDAA
jgi:hypothetical protein